MKKIIIGCIILLLISCATSPTVDTPDSYNLSFNVFEEADFITVHKISVQKDDSYIYIHTDFSTSQSATYLLFNPPNGDNIKLFREIDSSRSTVTEKILLKKLNTIEGLTIFITSQNDEAETEGIFIPLSELVHPSIPIIESYDIERREENMEVAVQTDAALPPNNINGSIEQSYSVEGNENYNAELNITLRGLEDRENVKIHFDEAWMAAKGLLYITTESPNIQSSPASYQFNIRKYDDYSRVGMTIFEDINNNNRYDPYVDTEITFTVTALSQNEGKEYTMQFGYMNFKVKVVGDSSIFTHPLIVTNYMGAGNFPTKTFPINTEELTLFGEIAEGQKGFTVVFDDTNQNGTYDPRENELFISNEVVLDIQQMDKLYTFRLIEEIPVRIETEIDITDVKEDYPSSAFTGVEMSKPAFVRTEEGLGLYIPPETGLMDPDDWTTLFYDAFPDWNFQEYQRRRQEHAKPWLVEILALVEYIEDSRDLDIQNKEFFYDLLEDHNIEY